MGEHVVQLTSNSHHTHILASLHDLKLQEQLCDVTVQLDEHADVQEFQAHQVVLAAISGYFKKILLAQDEAQKRIISVSNVHPCDFSAFLDFGYTGKAQVDRNKIADVQALAQFLDCNELTKACSEALKAGVVEEPTKKRRATRKKALNDSFHANKAKESITEVKSSSNCSKTNIIRKILKTKAKNRKGKKLEQKIKIKVAGQKIQKSRRYLAKETYSESQDTDEGAEGIGKKVEGEDDDHLESELFSDDPVTMGLTTTDTDDWDYGEDSQGKDSEDTSFVPEDEEGEMEEAGEGPSKKRSCKAQFQCQECQRTFHYEKSYLKHISTFHGVQAEIVHRCETCNQTFANRSNLKTHEKHVHNNNRLFVCESCSKTFKQKKDVVRHQKQVHEKRLQHLCLECGKSLSSKTALLLHERIHTGTKPYVCSDCGARFTQNSALKMHQRTHTGEKPFACDECSARFTQRHMLIYHKRSHTGEKPFMCEACGKSFASKEYLRHHSNIHTGSKPYKCDQCGRCFAQRNSLNQHLKIHTGERPYACKDCDKQFTQLNALQRHQRIHTGEKPYMCGLCKRTFTDKSTLRRHTSIHDTDAPWKTYLVVLEGNVEEKKSKTSVKEKPGKVRGREKKSGSNKKSVPAAAGPNSTPSTTPPPPAAPTTISSSGSTVSADKTQMDSIAVPAEPVTLSSDWTGQGAFALVSHGDLESITVIHTAVPTGMQIHPIMNSNGAGGSVISLEGSGISVPFSIPVSIKHPVSSTVTAPATSLSDTLLETVSALPSASTSSVLEAAASQTILSMASGNKNSLITGLDDEIESVIVGESLRIDENTEVKENKGQ